MFGMSGSHRAGKTTTARLIAEKMGIEFLETKVGDVFDRLGIDPKANLSFDERLKVQNEILRSLEIQYELRKGRVFIADRTPFDVMAYTTADIRRDTITTEQQRMDLTNHYARAGRIIREHLRGVIVLTPLKNQVDAPGKAQACPFYMEHVYSLVRVMVEEYGEMDSDLFAVLSQTYDLDERVADGVEVLTTLQRLYAPETKIWTPNS